MENDGRGGTLMDVSEWRVGDVLLCLNSEPIETYNGKGYRAGEYVCIREIDSNMHIREIDSRMKYVATTNARGGRNGWNANNFEWIDRGNFDDYVRISEL